MKKTLVFALLAAMTLSVTACGSNSSAENTSRTEKSESTDSKKNSETATRNKTPDNIKAESDKLLSNSTVIYQLSPSVVP